MQSRSRTAFTLIELLVVIAIIAILAAILFPVFAQAREKGRQTVCLSNLKQWGLAFNMYAQDYDERIPNQEPTDNVSWLTVIQPYAEKATNITDIGKDINNPNAPTGKTHLNICPSQSADQRAAEDSHGNPRPSTGGVSQSYGMMDYAVGAPGDERSYRPLAVFATPANTFLLGENYLNFDQEVYYPVDNDDYQVDTYAQGKATSSDPRFERCQTLPQVMPGVSVCASNLAPRHNQLANYAFVDGHAKAFRAGATFKADGSFSMWTITNTWHP
jgi:prepilin-type N-terminal cleavage/methylation domain-containing protein/prepilin-type processing-associated H-X9-DG protein